MTTAAVKPNFSTYAEATAWIAEGERLLGKKQFACSAEYKAAYPEISSLYRRDHGKRVRRARMERPLFGSSLILHAAGLK